MVLTEIKSHSLFELVNIMAVENDNAIAMLTIIRFFTSQEEKNNPSELDPHTLGLSYGSMYFRV